MDLELLLTHPKQGKDGRNRPMIIHHFQISKTIGKYGSGQFPGLDQLADLVSVSACESVDTFSVSSSHSSHDADVISVKPKRKRANAQQVKVLKKTFEQTPFPSSDTRRKLAKELGMTPRSVQIWFQNQRQLARNLVPMRSDSDDTSF